MPFVKGASGNPNGRPTKERKAVEGVADAELEKLIKKLKKVNPEAVDQIIAIMRSSTKEEIKIKAATWIVQTTVKLEQENERRKSGGKVPVSSGTEDGEEEKGAYFSLTIVKDKEE